MRSSWWKTALSLVLAAVCLYVFLPDSHPAVGQEKKKKKKDTVTLTFPPKLPDGKQVVTVTSEDFLKAPATIGKDVAIAKTPPTVDFLYYPGQTYPAKIWSNWGDGLAVNGKYYSSIGDHEAPEGHAFVFEYDPIKKAMRLLSNITELLAEILGYKPGKVHGRIDMGSDGWLYFSTHRGSTTVTSDANHYQGDWIIRCDPKSGKSEVVARGPVPKHCIPCSVLDPERLIFYGGTAPGTDAKDKGVQFFAYDVKNRKLLYSGPAGPPRYIIFAKSTGKIYYVPLKEDMVGPLMRYDPDKGGPPEKIGAELGLRAATQETPQGFVYTVSKGGKGGGSILYSFNTKTEQVQKLGPAAVGGAHYITTIDADPTGRYLYYIPGAHGGSDKDGSAVVQFDIKTRQRKVIAFLHPYFKDKYGATLVGTFSSAVDPAGDKLYITWNVNRGGRAWDCCALTVIHIPESERRP
jgi:hypothetical protein